MPDVPPTTSAERPYPTGWVTLAGVLLGALVGVLTGDVITYFPVSLAVGVALGVGLDSLLNHWLNPRADDDAGAANGDEPHPLAPSPRAGDGENIPAHESDSSSSIAWGKRLGDGGSQ